MMDSYGKQDQEKQQMITKLAVIKSIWESGNVPMLDKRAAQEWITDMFHFSMDLIGAKEEAKEPYSPPFKTPESLPKGLEKATIDEIVDNDAIEPQEPKGGYKFPPFVKKDGCISEAQSRRIFGIAKSKNVPSKMVNAYIKKLGYANTADIPWQQYKGIVAWVEGQETGQVPF